MADSCLFEDEEDSFPPPARLPKAIDENFDDFIFNFAENARFQLSRITFPLHLNAFGDDMVIEKREWEFCNVFGGRDYYTDFANLQSDSETETEQMAEMVCFENINLRDSVVRTLRFDKQDGRWKLTRQLLTRLDHHPLRDFLYFYRLFASDSIFQQQSLSENIRYITTDPDDDFQQIEGTISSAQWPSFAPELPSDEVTNIDYGQPLDAQRHVVLLKRGISNGLFDELHFRHTHLGWKLTSYEN